MASRVKGLISYILILSFVLQVFNYQTMVVKAATGDIELTWNQGQYLNNKLELPSGSTDDSALFYWDFSESGTYKLEYYLKDYAKVITTVDKVNDNTMHVYYQVYSYVDSADADTARDTWVNITDTVVGDYQFVDYKTTPVNFLLEDGTATLDDVDLHGTGDEKAVVFKDFSKGQLYPGATFKMNSNIMHFKWDDSANKFYFQTTGILPGQVTPFILKYKASDGSTKGPTILEAFTKLEEFEATPTHYYDGSGNSKRVFKEADPIAEGVIPGDHPGFNLNFKHPKVWDYSTQEYKEDVDVFETHQVKALIHIEEYGKDVAMDETIILDKATTPKFYDDTDPTNKRYDLRLVKNKVAGMGDNYVEWTALSPSTIYEVEAFLVTNESGTERYQTSRNITYDSTNIDTKIEFTNYKPNGGYAYTYLDYELKRESIDEAYLEITPYGGIEDDIIKYDVYIAKPESWLEDNSENELARWLTYTHEIGSEEYEGKLYIPVRFTGGDGLHYKIKMYFDGQETERKLFTQLLHYASKSDELVPPPTSVIKSISDIKVLPAKSGVLTDEPTEITADLTWEAPDEDLLRTLLAKGDLYYELLINEEPLNGTGSKSFETIKLFKVTLDGTDIKVSTEKGGSSSAEDSTYYVNGYNKHNNTFRINDMEIKLEGDPTAVPPETGWMKVFEADYDEIKDGAGFLPTVVEKTVAGDEVDYEGVKDLPNVNFLRMRTIYLRDTDTDDVYDDGSYSKMSIAKGMSLSNVALDVPISKALTHENIMTGTNKTRFELKWDKVNLTNYINSMLTPIDKKLNDDDLYYEVYLTQDKNKLTHLDTVEDDTEFDFTDTYDPNNPMVVDFSLPANATKLEKLRNGEVIAIKVPGSVKDSYGKAKVAIEGTDQNQVYHMAVVTRIDARETATPTNVEIRRASPSETLSLTTLNLGGPIEVMPLVPEDFKVVEVISSSAIKLGWLAKMKELSPSESIGYEIVRVEGRTLGTDFSPTTAQEAIITSSNDIEGWRITDGNKDEDFVMERYDKEKKVWEVVDDQLSVALSNFNMIDNTLEPNKIYYYYLRAVRVDKHATDVIIDRSKPASEWTALTFTSDPLKAPINLTQSFDKSVTDHYDDDKNQALIYFDVAVPDTGSDSFEPEVFLFSEDDRDIGDQYINLMTDSSDFDILYIKKDTNNVPTGHVRYYYLIENLKSGMSYSVKVRIKTKDTNPNYSSFSDRIVIRTEFDGDEYENNQKLNYYLDYYELETDKLFKTLYWDGLDSSKKPEMKFRQYTAMDELASLTKGRYVVDAGDVEYLTVYLPNPMIDLFYDKNIEFAIKHKDMTLTLDPETLRKSKIDAYKDMNKVLDKDKNLKEYYVKLIFKFKNYDYKINGQAPVSDLVKMEVELVASKQHEINLEKIIIDKLEGYIQSHRNKVQNKLIEKINTGEFSEDELLEIVDDEIVDIKNYHKSFVSNEIQKATDRNKTESIFEFYEPMRIGIEKKGKGTIALYKREEASWKKQIAKNNSFDIHADMDTAGEYIFAGYATEELISPEIKNGRKMNNLISKYDLMDFLTIVELSEMKKDVTKYNMYYMLARVLGAPSDVNALNWLDDQDFQSISKKRLYNGLKRDEAYDLLIQGYGYKNNVNLNTVRINNRYAISDLNQVNPQYREHLLVASQVNLLPLENGKLNPQDNMSLEEFLNALLIIEYKNW